MTIIEGDHCFISLSEILDDQKLVPGKFLMHLNITHTVGVAYVATVSSVQKEWSS